jgi:hypothetical protein
MSPLLRAGRGRLSKIRSLAERVYRAGALLFVFLFVFVRQIVFHQLPYYL